MDFGNTALFYNGMGCAEILPGGTWSLGLCVTKGNKRRRLGFKKKLRWEMGFVHFHSSCHGQMCKRVSMNL